MLTRIYRFPFSGLYGFGNNTTSFTAKPPSCSTAGVNDGVNTGTGVAVIVSVKAGVDEDENEAVTVAVFEAVNVSLLVMTGCVNVGDALHVIVIINDGVFSGVFVPVSV
jgi:hypothetical protein